MQEVLLSCGTENEEVVKVDEKEGKGTEKGVHEALESLGGVFKTKWHEIKLEKAEGGNYCCFWNVVFLHRHLIITLLQI
jgi:hypothetical protein